MQGRDGRVKGNAKGECAEVKRVKRKRDYRERRDDDVRAEKENGKENLDATLSERENEIGRRCEKKVELGKGRFFI